MVDEIKLSTNQLINHYKTEKYSGFGTMDFAFAQSEVLLMKNI